MEKLYFHYKVDCEPLRDKFPACGGPSSWEASEETILRFLETFHRYGMVKGAGFYLTPEAVKAIVAGGHNTEYVHFENVEYVIEYVFEAADRVGMELVPAQPPDLRRKAEELGRPQAPG